MNIFLKGHTIRGAVVEMAKQRFRDEAVLRLARISNGVEPEYVNGSPKAAEKGLTKAATKRTY